MAEGNARAGAIWEPTVRRQRAAESPLALGKGRTLHPSLRNLVKMTARVCVSHL